MRISLLIIKSRDTSNGKIGHFLASLFADSIPFPYDIPWFQSRFLEIDQPETRIAYGSHVC